MVIAVWVWVWNLGLTLTLNLRIWVRSNFDLPFSLKCDTEDLLNPLELLDLITHLLLILIADPNQFHHPR